MSNCEIISTNCHTRCRLWRRYLQWVFFGERSYLFYSETAQYACTLPFGESLITALCLLSKLLKYFQSHFMRRIFQACPRAYFWLDHDLTWLSRRERSGTRTCFLYRRFRARRRISADDGRTRKFVARVHWLDVRIDLYLAVQCLGAKTGHERFIDEIISTPPVISATV